MGRDAHARKKAYRKGLWAEWLAVVFLCLKGYRPLARRFKTPVGEVDLICRKKQLIVFVEVKARRSSQLALDSISYTAQKRITGAGEWWLMRQKNAGQLSWRFDVIAVVPWRLPVHFENVW